MGEDAEFIAPEMEQINTIIKNFDLFFKNIDSYDDLVYRPGR